MNIRKGDLVEVITGEEKGKTGKVIDVQAKKNSVIIEGVNFVKRHKRASARGEPGGVVDIPAPIHVSNVSLICPKCGERTRVGRTKVESHRARICKQCEEIID